MKNMRKEMILIARIGPGLVGLLQTPPAGHLAERQCQLHPARRRQP